MLTEAAVLLFIGSVFAVPGAASIVTSILRRATDPLGLDPTVVVYVVSFALGGAILANAFPAWTGDPFVYIGLLTALGTAWAELSRRLYDAILSHLPGLKPAP